jgi:hypothetical protein
MPIQPEQKMFVLKQTSIELPVPVLYCQLIAGIAIVMLTSTDGGGDELPTQ